MLMAFQKASGVEPVQPVQQRSIIISPFNDLRTVPRENQEVLQFFSSSIAHDRKYLQLAHQPLKVNSTL